VLPAKITGHTWRVIVARMSIRIEPRRLSELTEMTALQQAEMAARYGGEGGSGAPPRDEEFVPPEGVFLVALREGVVIGCGGICRHPEGGGEIRRMYVAPEARGAGVGRTVLEALEQWAVDLGFDTLRLETGDRLVDAIRLYERAGYRRGPCWGPYLTDPKSVCFRKSMTAP
jgi:GNAT superfamily N-acetyltransferase